MNRSAALAAVLLILCSGSIRAGEPDQRLVRIMVTYQEHDSFLPWRTEEPAHRRGYGILLDGKRVLTTESLIRNHRLVELRRPLTGEKIPADVVMSDIQVDLALLQVREEIPDVDTSALAVAGAVPRDATLRAVQLDRTRAIQTCDATIRQIGVQSMASASYSGLTFTILTAENVEGTGAPVLYDDKLCGLVASYDSESRTGSMIPYSTISRFLADIAEQPYEGFASAGFVWRPLVDPARRRYLNVERPGKGIQVLSCIAGTDAARILRSDDVILEWDGHEIDNLGYYTDAEFGRLQIAHLIKGRRKPGELIPITIVRDRTELLVSLSLVNLSDQSALVPQNTEGRPDEYLIAGGFVIRELSGRYLKAFGSEWRRKVDSRLVHIYLNKSRAPENEGDRVVILGGVLPDEINTGYTRHRNAIVTAVNGQPVNNMSDVFRIVDADGSLIRLRLHQIEVDFVLDQDELPAADKRISELYRIPTLRRQFPSPSLR